MSISTLPSNLQMALVEQPNSCSSNAWHQASCFRWRSSYTAEGSSICAEHPLLVLLQVVIMHNAQPSGTPSLKGHICLLLICFVGCAHSSPASDGKQLQIPCLSHAATTVGQRVDSAATVLTPTHGLCSFCAVAVQRQHHQLCHSQQL